MEHLAPSSSKRLSLVHPMIGQTLNKSAQLPAIPLFLMPIVGNTLASAQLMEHLAPSLS